MDLSSQATHLDVLLDADGESVEAGLVLLALPGLLDGQGAGLRLGEEHGHAARLLRRRQRLPLERVQRHHRTDGPAAKELSKWSRIPSEIGGISCVVELSASLVTRPSSR